MEHLREDMILSAMVFTKALGIHYMTYVQWRNREVKHARPTTVEHILQRAAVIESIRDQLGWRKNNPLVSRMHPRRRDEVFLECFKKQFGVN